MANSEVHCPTDRTKDSDGAACKQTPFTLADASKADVRAAATTPDTSGLHSVEIHGGADAAAPVRETRTEQPSGSTPKREWTVAYYLGATKTMPEDGKPGDKAPPPSTDWGSAHKAEQLKEMAKATEGTGVTVLVDSLRMKESVREQRQKLVDQGKLTADELATHKPEDYVVDHYRMRDGKLETLGSSQSKGLTGDVSDLVSHAAKDEPSAKVGLVMNVDGGGNRGAMGDSSPISTTGDLQSAIASGLKDSGHDRLDVLNMDACLMGQTGALGTLSTVAKDIVASAETERSSVKRVDGQNLPTGLQHLLDHPEISGKAWGEQIVDDAKKGANANPHPAGEPTRFDTGTATLANFDGDKMKALTDATSQLGAALKTALADGKSRSTIDDITSRIPRLGADGSSVDSYGEQKRDLKTFTDELQKAVDAGQIADPKGDLAAAIASVRSAREGAVTSYNGDRPGGYDKSGGVSVYLPDKTFRDLDKTLSERTPLAQAAEVLSRFRQLPTPKEGPPELRDGSMTAATAQHYVAGYLRDLTDQQKKEAAPLVSAMKQLKDATSLQDRQAALTRASEAAQQLLESPLQRQLIAAQDHKAADERRRQKLDRELGGELPGWKDFVQAMEWRS